MEAYKKFLWEEERSKATIDKYMRDLNGFYEFLGKEKYIRKERLICYKAYLIDKYKSSSVNSMIASINNLLRWMGLEQLRVKGVRVQKNTFCSEDRELKMQEYHRLIQAAKRRKNRRLELILQTICGTGIRVSELTFITKEALQHNYAEVSSKGKQRKVFITDKLRKYLLVYCREKGITSGPIFITRTGRPVSRTNIWMEMKKLCADAQVEPGKVFPHNLRHLFARTYYKQKQDIVYLADILGHSSIETTRIYTICSGNEQEEIIRKLKLVI